MTVVFSIEFMVVNFTECIKEVRDAPKGAAPFLISMNREGLLLSLL
jgi:hypothetical protein